jgi:hypothetical protein
LFSDIVKRLLVERHGPDGDFQSPTKLVDVFLEFFLFDGVGIRLICGVDFAFKPGKGVPVSYMARRDEGFCELTPG